MGYPVYNNAGDLIGEREMPSPDVTWYTFIPDDMSFVYTANSTGHLAPFTIINGRLSIIGITNEMSVNANAGMFDSIIMSDQVNLLPLVALAGIAGAAYFILKK